MYEENFGTNVSRLKNRFQTELENRIEQDRNAYNRSNSYMGSSTRSPEMKRKKSDPMTDVTHVQNRAVVPEITPANNDPTMADPQKFFESTSHVQRFKYTRAIFAKMEQQNQVEQERKKQYHRRVSPSQTRGVSPTSPTSTSPDRRALSPSRPEIPPKPAQISHMTDVRKSRIEYHRQTSGDYNNSSEPDTIGRRSSSQDRYGPKPPSFAQGRQFDNSVSRSESDLTRDEPEEHHSARWLKNRFEEEARKQTTYVAPQRPNRFIKNENREPVTAVRTDINHAGPVRKYSAGSPDRTSRTSPEDARPMVHRRTSGSDEIPGTSRAEPHPAVENKEDNVPSWRRNKTNRIDWNDNKTSGVLLPKRRSREEKTLPTKAEIEASLSEADSYWHKNYGNDLPETMDSSKMTDSTYSSGSGEEMARSDSSHELSGESPTSPTTTEVPPSEVPRRDWVNKYNAKRRSRNSDDFEDKVAEINKRNSRNSDNFEEKVVDITQQITSTSTDSSDGSLSRSSSEASMKRNSVLENVPQPTSILPSYSDSITHGYTAEPDTLPSYDASVSRVYSSDDSNLPSYDSATRRYLNEQDNYPSISITTDTTSDSSATTVESSATVVHTYVETDTDTDHILDEEPVTSPKVKLEPVPLGIKKSPSPNESVDSMTPSEQDHMLSKP